MNENLARVQKGFEQLLAMYDECTSSTYVQSIDDAISGYIDNSKNVCQNHLQEIGLENFNVFFDTILNIKKQKSDETKKRLVAKEQAQEITWKRRNAENFDNEFEDLTDNTKTDCPITIKVDEVYFELLKFISNQIGRNRSEVIRPILEKYLLERYFDFMQYQLAKKGLPHNHSDVCQEIATQIQCADISQQTFNTIKCHPVFRGYDFDFIKKISDKSLRVELDVFFDNMTDNEKAEYEEFSQSCQEDLQKVEDFKTQHNIQIKLGGEILYWDIKEVIFVKETQMIFVKYPFYGTQEQVKYLGDNEREPLLMRNGDYIFEEASGRLFICQL